MGCNQSREVAISGLKDQIKHLHEQKSKLLIEKDKLKPVAALYSLSEEELALQNRLLSAECTKMTEELARLEGLKEKKSKIQARIEELTTETLKNEGFLISSLNTLSEKKQEYLKTTEDVNKTLQATAKLSAEYSKNAEILKEFSVASSESALLDQQISDLTDKLALASETLRKTSANEEEIRFLESEIEKITPLIESQNKSHEYLLELDSDIQILQSGIKALEIADLEKNYFTQIKAQFEDVQLKIADINLKLEELSNYDFNKKKEEKETHIFIKNTLKKELKESSRNDREDIKLMKLENKKLKLESVLNRKIKNYDVEYESLCFKLQKKQAQKVSLETQLKEFQEIAGELE